MRTSSGMPTATLTDASKHGQERLQPTQPPTSATKNTNSQQCLLHQPHRPIPSANTSIITSHFGHQHHPKQPTSSTNYTTNISTISHHCQQCLPAQPTSSANATNNFNQRVLHNPTCTTTLLMHPHTHPTRVTHMQRGTLPPRVTVAPSAQPPRVPTTQHRAPPLQQGLAPAAPRVDSTALKLYLRIITQPNCHSHAG